MICFDTEKKCTSEDIQEWFNGRLVGCGLEPWKRNSKKWAIAKGKLKCILYCGNPEIARFNLTTTLYFIKNCTFLIFIVVL